MLIPKTADICLGLGWGYRGGVVDGPALVGGAFEQGGGGVDGEGAAGDGEHGGVVDGVAEDGVGVGDAGAEERGDFTLVGGDVGEGLGNEAVDDLHAGGEDSVGGDVESLDALFDDPVVGGADGPDVDAFGLEGGDELEHLGEDVLFDAGLEEGAGGGAHLLFAEAVVHLDHLAADVELGDLAALVAAVFGVDPVGGLAGDEAGLDGPGHKGGACVTGPEGAVAVEDGYGGGELVDGGVKLGGVQVLRGKCVRHGKPFSLQRSCCCRWPAICRRLGDFTLWVLWDEVDSMAGVLQFGNFEAVGRLNTDWRRWHRFLRRNGD